VESDRTKGSGTERPRPLTRRERDVLDYLLSVETPGIAELRQQAETARAIPWDCGCASIDLIVDREAAPKSSVQARPAVEAASNERNDPERTFDLLLWVEDGWLSGIEIVDYGETHGSNPATFLPLDSFAPPRAP
jgi:hypothetical protein